MSDYIKGVKIMGKIAWVTDSTAFIDEELANHPDVYTVPMVIYFGEDEYLDGVNITKEQFQKLLVESEIPPKTSQPSVGTFAELYNQLAQNYDQIVSIHLSSHLSGTVSSSQQAAKLVDIPVTTIDTKTLSYPLTAMLKTAIKLVNEGHSIEEVERKLDDMVNKSELYVLIGSLEQLHRSGRMTSVQKVLGSLLQIKPIIAIKDGKLDVAEKVRTEKKVFQRMLELFDDAFNRGTVKELYLLYGREEEQTFSIKQKIKETYPNLKVGAYPISTTISVHAGVDTVGLAWFNE